MPRTAGLRVEEKTAYAECPALRWGFFGLFSGPFWSFSGFGGPGPKRGQKGPKRAKLGPPQGGPPKWPFSAPRAWAPLGPPGPPTVCTLWRHYSRHENRCAPTCACTLALLTLRNPTSRCVAVYVSTGRPIPAYDDVWYTPALIWRYEALRVYHTYRP